MSKIYFPPKHHLPILEDPVNYYYFPLFQRFFRARLELVLSFVRGEKLGAVLDLGCASGILLPELSRRSEILVGMDLFLQDYSLKGLMKKEGFQAHLTWADAMELPFKNNTFDTIVCISVLEHIGDSPVVLNEINRVLKSGGRLLAGFPVQNVFTDRLLGESTGFHIASHRKILNSAERIFRHIKIKHLPAFLPLNLSFYCAFKGEKR